MDGTNYSIRDEIRDFWSARAATFDESVGHEIFSESERRAWHRLTRRNLGEGQGRRALDLACGTGVISHLMADMGFAVTGLDWSEAMLDRARAKAKKRGADIRFLMRDAERTGEDPASYDAIITRHLVWTLVDVPAAFTEWFALLKPGGTLLIVDGNFGRKSAASRLAHAVAGRLGLEGPQRGLDPAARARHESIRSRVWFSSQMTAGAVVELLVAAGFETPAVDRNLWAIHWAQARKMDPLRAIDRLTADRFAIRARKPPE
jgi:2-polyprenyl-3-methyl-5-hydroxy-6-metoxy-1,4-benzoquinol methylase